MLHLLAEADPTSFTEFISNLGQLVTGIVDVWSSIIAQIVDSANYILIIPVMVYLFVVATASLRSFYKG